MESKNILSIKNLSKTYKKTQVLKNISFEIKKGDIVALVGVNGAGKSTLMEIICGVKQKSSGLIEGLENKVYDFGYMAQSFSLFNDLSIKENLQYFATIYKLDFKIVNEIIKKCNLGTRQNYLCKNLSGGYKQLLSLGVALIHNPKLLILDEPTSAMDPIFRDAFWKVIKDFNKNGGTVLVTTHYMEEIFECNKLLILSNGQIVFDDFVKNAFTTYDFKDAIELIKFYTQGEQYGK